MKVAAVFVVNLLGQKVKAVASIIENTSAYTMQSNVKNGKIRNRQQRANNTQSKQCAPSLPPGRPLKLRSEHRGRGSSGGAHCLHLRARCTQ